MNDQIIEDMIKNDPYEYSLFQTLKNKYWVVIREALHYEATAHDINQFKDCDTVILVGRLYLIIQAIDELLYTDDPYPGLLTEYVGFDVLRFLQINLSAVLDIWDDCYSDSGEDNLEEQWYLLQEAYHALFQDNEWPAYELARIVRD